MNTAVQQIAWNLGIRLMPGSRPGFSIICYRFVVYGMLDILNGTPMASRRHPGRSLKICSQTDSIHKLRRVATTSVSPRQRD